MIQLQIWPTWIALVTKTSLVVTKLWINFTKTSDLQTGDREWIVFPISSPATTDWYKRATIYCWACKQFNYGCESYDVLPYDFIDCMHECYYFPGSCVCLVICGWIWSNQLLSYDDARAAMQGQQRGKWASSYPILCLFRVRLIQEGFINICLHAVTKIHKTQWLGIVFQLLSKALHRD